MTKTTQKTKTKTTQETQEEFLDNYNPLDYPSVAVTVDTAIFTIRYNAKGEFIFAILLIKRRDYPYKGYWALPGGFLNQNENSDEAALRETFEETGINPGHIEQLRTYSTPGRDPRMRVVTIAYLTFTPIGTEPVGGDDASEARFIDVRELDNLNIAFDHKEIIADAIERCRSKLEYTSLATDFLPPTFTMSELRQIYEVVWGYKLNPTAFRRKVLDCEIVSPTSKVHHTKGRPATKYKPKSSNLHPPFLRLK